MVKGRQLWEGKQAERDEQEKLQTEEVDNTRRLEAALAVIKTCVGFSSKYESIIALLSTNDQYQSASVSRMLQYHGTSLLDAIHKCRPDITTKWMGG
jgi:hypothetical protein